MRASSNDSGRPRAVDSCSAEVGTGAQLWLPDLVSTPNSEVRITFSPYGTRMLWGAIGWSAGAGGWDIYESERSPEGWSAPKSVPFNSDANDFDPSLRRTARVSIFSPIARAASAKMFTTRRPTDKA